MNLIINVLEEENVDDKIGHYEFLDKNEE